MKMNYCNDEPSCCYTPDSEYCGCGEGRRYSKCEQLSPCPHPILFEASCGTTTNVPQTFTMVPKKRREEHEEDKKPYPITADPKSIVCLTLDTTCLKSPTTLVEFGAQIFIKFKDEQSIPAKIDFELVVCDCGCETVCGTWSYSHFMNCHEGEDEILDYFGFSKVSAASCPGCTNYSVRMVNFANDPNEICVFEVRNATLSAMAKSSC